ncbi:MAG: hypothetical protein PVI44_06280 [Balneolaceae bacterium]|jgi:hypothetical protein
MKIQTTALLEQVVINEKVLELPDSVNIDLEFSAIDTGGGFHDPILDFTFTLNNSWHALTAVDQKSIIELVLRDPRKDENKAGFSCKCEIAIGETQTEVNGRLYEEEISRALIGFVMKRFR